MREYIRPGREATGYDGLARSGMTAVFDNVMDGTCCISSDGGWKCEDVLHDLGMRMSDLAHQDYVVKARVARRTSGTPTRRTGSPSSSASRPRR